MTSQNGVYAFCAGLARLYARIRTPTPLCGEQSVEHAGKVRGDGVEVAGRNYA
jgi:hypothetical protein